MANNIYLQQKDPILSTDFLSQSPNLFSPPLPLNSDPYLNLQGDKLREECGVFGVFNHPDAAVLTALGLHALQHRGQEAAGIITYDGSRFRIQRRLGLVGDHFTKRPVIDKLKGNAAIGHVRYSTTGDSISRNVQPLFADLHSGGFAICHNGNLTNALTVRDQLIKGGSIFQTTSDTEVLLHLVAQSEKSSFVERFIDSLIQIEGAYAFAGLTNKKLIGARDPLGIRPLVLGKLGDATILASETCALDTIGAEFVREIKNGEVVVINHDGIESHHPFPERPARPCIFEYIYFARPDSILGGRSVYEIRKDFGKQLAREAGVEADLVIPIPDSGIPAAIGFANEADIPFDLGIVRNHYVGRTFIEPEQQIRQLGVKLKHSANTEIVKGKRVILIDDSIVRGTTSLKIIEMMSEAGAKEVHMRIACPPITHSDYYGIDTPDRHKLLAANHSLEEMRKIMRATSLAFLSVEGIYKAMGYQGRDNDNPQFTDHCFTGDYPTRLRDREGPPQQKQLSLLAEAS